MQQPEGTTKVALDLAGLRAVRPGPAGGWIVTPVGSVPGGRSHDGPSGEGKPPGPPDDGRWQDGLVAYHVSAPVDRLVDDEPVDHLLRLRHPHLAAVRDVVALDEAGVLVLCAPASGRAASEALGPGPITEGEAATLAIPLAQGLGALHEHGLVHGGFRLGSVVVTCDGVPVLADPSPAVTLEGSPRGDLCDLLDAVLGVLPGPEVYAAAGLGPGTLHDTLLRLRERPELCASDVVRACFGAVEPLSLRLVDAGTAGSGPTTHPTGAPVRGRPADPGLEAGRLLRAAGARPSPSGRRRVVPPVRARHAGRSRRPAVAAALAGLVVLVAVGALVRPLTSGTSTAPAAAPSPSLSLSEDPARAAAQLTQLRGDLLAGVGAADLGLVEVSGGPAWLADRATVGALVGAQVVGHRTSVDESAAVAVGADGTARVELTSSESGYVRIERDGTRRDVPAVGPRTVVLELHRTAEGWRVWSVSQPSTP